MLKIVEASVEEELRLDQIWMVGQYAIGMRWGDGHDTGIYTFDYLYELCDRSRTGFVEHSASND